jgi:hypothetical protein
MPHHSGGQPRSTAVPEGLGRSGRMLIRHGPGFGIAPKIMRSQIRDFSLGGRRLTICQTAFGVIPSPHTFSSRFTRRKIGPSPMPATLIHSSTALRPCRYRTVRMCFPFPIRSATTQCSSRTWKSCLLSPTSSARRSPQPISSARMARSRLPRTLCAREALQQPLGLLGGQPVADPHPKALSTLHATNASSKFRAQQARVSGLVRKPADGGHAHVDG